MLLVGVVSAKSYQLEWGRRGIRVAVEGRGGFSALRGIRGTPTGRAADGGHTEVVKILLKPGANLNPEARNSPETTLQDAAHRGHLAVVKLLHRAVGGEGRVPSQGSYVAVCES